MHRWRPKQSVFKAANHLNGVHSPLSNSTTLSPSCCHLQDTAHSKFSAKYISRHSSQHALEAWYLCFRQRKTYKAAWNNQKILNATEAWYIYFHLESQGDMCKITTSGDDCVPASSYYSLWNFGKSKAFHNMQTWRVEGSISQEGCLECTWVYLWRTYWWVVSFSSLERFFWRYWQEPNPSSEF